MEKTVYKSITALHFYRYRKDSDALNEWMEQAKEHLHTWKDNVTLDDQETDHAISHFKQFTVSVKIIKIYGKK